MEATIVRNRQGSMVGRIEDSVFHKDVYRSKHMLRKPAAWAIDADIFDRAIKPNCGAIHIHDKETHATYVVGVKTFAENKKVLDRGHGKQYYLELIFWQNRSE